MPVYQWHGSLDRLLVSELAQDDLVLSARLALNEALYLRRESPPKAPQAPRSLLVDNGIRLSGIPRLFVAAVALAMEAMSDRGTKVSSFIPTRHHQLKEVRLHTREGLMEALSYLHPHSHPGNALLELVRRVKDREEQSEMILITHKDVLDDPAFQSVSALLNEPFYTAAVDRQGGYSFYRCHQQGRRVLHRARLDLDKLMGNADEASRLRRPDVPTHLPSIFHERPFPIRLSMTMLRDRTIFTKEDGVFKSSRDGRLLHFNDSDRGGLQICDNLPPGKPISVVEAQSLINGCRVVALMGKKCLHLCLVHPSSGVNDSFEMQMTSVPAQVVVAHQQVLVIHARRVNMHEMKHGEQLAEIELQGRVERCYGDLLLIKSEWHRVSIDGMRPCLETIDQDRVMETSRMEEYRLTVKGALRKNFRGVSLMGSKIVLHTKQSNQQFIIGYHQPTKGLCFRPITLDVQPELFRAIEGPEGSRLELKEVCWPDGSRLVLDPRRLLRFVISSEKIDEFTLILSDTGGLSAWAGDAGCVGDSYYFSESPALDAEAVRRMMDYFALRIAGEKQ
ncbi:MAG: hypothetical protein ACI9DF_006072 [Verrucomicrobiales bacterium]